VRVRAAVLCLSLLLGGCGSTASNGSSMALSRQRFLGQADAICGRADEKARSLTSGSRIRPESVVAAATLLEQTERELEALHPPSELAAGFRRFLTLAGAEVHEVAELATSIRKRNATAARSLARKLNSTTSNEEAKSIGLTVCAKETS
jgi:hypothetical protein